MPGMMTSQESLVERQGNCHLHILEITNPIEITFCNHILDDDQHMVLFKTYMFCLVNSLRFQAQLLRTTFTLTIPGPDTAYDDY